MKTTNSDIIFINGAFCPFEEAKIPIDDRGFLYGDGVFTSLRVWNGQAFLFDEHINRLKEQCLILRMIPPDFDPDLILQLIQHNQAQDGLWKLKILITGGNSRSLALPSRRPGQMIGTIHPYEKILEPLRLILYPKASDPPIASLKTLAYLDRLVMRQYALDHGCHDVISTLRDGTLLEASSSNLFWKMGDVFYTPHFSLPLLKGLGLKHVLGELMQSGFAVHQVQCTIDAIEEEACLYLVNSVQGVVAVEELEGRKLSRDLGFESWANQIFESS